MIVEVRNGNVDQAIRVLKKKLQQDGLFNELREREFYKKPSQLRKERNAKARLRRKNNSNN